MNAIITQCYLPIIGKAFISIRHPRDSFARMCIVCMTDNLDTGYDLLRASILNSSEYNSITNIKVIQPSNIVDVLLKIDPTYSFAIELWRLYRLPIQTTDYGIQIGSVVEHWYKRKPIGYWTLWDKNGLLYEQKRYKLDNITYLTYYKGIQLIESGHSVITEDPYMLYIEVHVGHRIRRNTHGLLIFDGYHDINGQKTGHWIYQSLGQRNQIDCSYLYGKRNGYWREQYKDGRVIEGQYTDDEQSGNWLWLYASGQQMMCGHYTNGIMIGSWKLWLCDGQLVISCTFNITDTGSKYITDWYLIDSIPTNIPYEINHDFNIFYRDIIYYNTHNKFESVMFFLQRCDYGGSTRRMIDCYL